MSYATPFYYAAKAIAYDPPAHVQHSRQTNQRRRRIRLILFPALRLNRHRASVGPATSTGSR